MYSSTFLGSNSTSGQHQHNPLGRQQECVKGGDSYFSYKRIRACSFKRDNHICRTVFREVPEWKWSHNCNDRWTFHLQNWKPECLLTSHDREFQEGGTTESTAVYSTGMMLNMSQNTDFLNSTTSSLLQHLLVSMDPLTTCPTPTPETCVSHHNLYQTMLPLPVSPGYGPIT